MNLTGRIKIDYASDYNLIVTVIDKNNKPIPSVGVLVRSYETQQDQVAFTDDFGVVYFDIPQDKDNKYFCIRLRRVEYVPQNIHYIIKQGINNLTVTLEK